MLVQEWVDPYQGDFEAVQKIHSCVLSGLKTLGFVSSF